MTAPTSYMKFSSTGRSQLNSTRQASAEREDGTVSMTSHEKSDTQDHFDNTLSPFLAHMVKEGIIPQAVAEVFNRLPTAAEQSRALNKVREGILPLATQTVNEMLNTHVNLGSQTHIMHEEVEHSKDPILESSTHPDRISSVISFSNSLKRKIVVKSEQLWIKGIHLFRKIDADQINKYVFRHTTVIVAGSLISIAFVWNISEWIAHKAHIVNYPSASAPLAERSMTETVPMTAPAKMEEEKDKASNIHWIKRNGAHVHDTGRHRHAITDVVETKTKISSAALDTHVPDGLKATVVGPNQIRLTWESAGTQYKYHVLSDSSRRMNDPQREDDHALSSTEMIWSPTTDAKGLWVAVSAVDSDNHQGPLSDPIYVKLK